MPDQSRLADPSPAAAETLALLRMPILLDAEPDARRGPIDLGWRPQQLQVSGARRGGRSSALLAAGFALLIVGWLALSAGDFAIDQFRRSTGLGALTAIVFGIALGLMLVGVWREAKSYRALRRVEGLREALDGADLPKAQELCESWLRTLRPHDFGADEAIEAVQRAKTLAGIKAALRSHVVEPLRRRAQEEGRSAAVQGAAIVAITPSPALDGLLAGLRGLAVVRRIALTFGLRPGPAVTIILLRRVAWTVASVSGIELLSRSVADHVLERTPLKHLAGALPGMSVTAVRLYRLANAAAEACSPVPLSEPVAARSEGSRPEEMD